MSRHFSSGRCALIAIWFGISITAATSPQGAFGGTSFCVQRSEPPQSNEPVLRSEVDLKTVNVQVKNKQGNNVPGLAAHDFTVLENGKPQKIAFFDAGNGPVTVAVLVDSSSSMASEGRLGSAAEIAARFMRIARPRDEIWAMDFTAWTGPFVQIAEKQLAKFRSDDRTGCGRCRVSGVRRDCDRYMSSAEYQQPEASHYRDHGWC